MTLKELERAIRQMRDVLLASGVVEEEVDEAEVHTLDGELHLTAKKGAMEICLTSSGKEGGR